MSVRINGKPRSKTKTAPPEDTENMGSTEDKSRESFESKPKIVAKRDQDQREITHFFRVTKRVKAQPKKNFQGFPMDSCVYASEIDGYVMEPCKSVYSAIKKGPTDWPLCDRCYLRPCYVTARREELMNSFGEAHMEISKPEELFVGDEHHLRLIEGVREDLKIIFGSRYVRDNFCLLLPGCVEDVIESFFRDLCARFGVTWTILDEDDIIPS